MTRFRNLVLAGLGLLVALALFGFAGSWQQPRVVRYTVALADWPPGAPPLRIVQLSDIHGSRIDMPPSRIARIVDQVNTLHPDMIVLTGDYCCGKRLDNRMLPVSQIVAPLGRLQAPLGVYAVLGNHDTKIHSIPAFTTAGVPLLIDRWVDAGPVVVAGVDDGTNFANPAIGLRKFAAGVPTGKPVILLAHEPDFFQYMPSSISLLIAGHTHGGQIILPLIGTRSLGAYLDGHLRGQFSEHGQAMVVSSGLGTSIIPVRIGVRPEIVEITVQGRSGGGQASGRKSGTER